MPGFDSGSGGEVGDGGELIAEGDVGEISSSSVIGLILVFLALAASTSRGRHRHSLGNSHSP